MFDVTEILVAFIALFAVAISGVLGWVWVNYVKPWLEDRRLVEVAEIVVQAVEALVGRGHGEQKWLLALEKIEEWGFAVDEQRVVDALKAAWKKMDLSQIMAGEKEAT